MSKPKSSFYEIVAKDSTHAEVFMYGFIGPYDDIDDKVFVREWSALEATYKEVTVHLNSGGGSVFSGIAIYNTVRNSPLREKTIIINEGLAGSMASIFFLAVPKENRHMASNARIMTHKPSGGTYGSAKKLRDTADTMDGLEQTMAEIYSEATEKTEEEVKEWMKEGVDKYFTANEAEEAGLVGKVIGAPKSKAPSAKLTEEAALYEHYRMCLTKKDDSNTQNQFKTMNKTLLIALLATAGFAAKLTEESTDADFMAAFKNVLEAKEKEILRLSSALEKSEGDKVTALIDQAVASGKILPAHKDSFTALAKTDFVNTAKIIEAMPGKVSMTETIKGTVQEQAAGVVAKEDSKENWDFTMWRKQDPKGLERMMQTNPQAYEKLREDFVQTKRT